MPERWIGVVVASEKITVVDVEVPARGPLVVTFDQTWPLQDGDRAAAYAVIHQQVADYITENSIKRCVVKATALSLGSVKMAHMEAAELRGVVMCAAAPIADTLVIAKATMSRTFGKRKVDDYVRDNDFWRDEVTGESLRRGSREAAMVLLAARDS